MTLPRFNFRQLYNQFDAPVTPLDCGERCASHNPSGKPFCCDICQAVPAVYQSEWEYLRPATDLWHAWQGTECQENPEDPAAWQPETPQGMLLLACLGPDRCQRAFRALSCRQFPFFPYISEDFRFLGLAYEWEFEPFCWVISRLEQVTPAYRQEFVRAYTHLFEIWPGEFNSYLLRSEELREHYRSLKRRFPLLHRNGGYYLVSPGSGRLQRIPPERLPRFGPYRQPDEPVMAP